MNKLIKAGHNQSFIKSRKFQVTTEVQNFFCIYLGLDIFTYHIILVIRSHRVLSVLEFFFLIGMETKTLNLDYP